MKKILFATLLFSFSLASHAAVIAKTSAVITNITGEHKIGAQINLYSHHSYFVTNTNLVDVSCILRMKLCPADWPEKCFDTSDIPFVVKANTTMSNEFNYTTAVKYYSNGSKYVYAETSIMGCAKSIGEDSKYITIG